MWEVIGYEKSITRKEGQQDYESFRIYVKKPVKPGPNAEGEKCRSYWYKAHEIDYVPQVGDKIFVETETFGKFEVVTDIYPV